MPEYLAPGVYVEETSFRSKSIEGVSTTTTGFIGPTRFGPIDLEPDVITSLGEFERVYGDREQLVFDGEPASDNFLWHAARAFFEEGGRRLYVARVFKPKNTDDGHARANLSTGGTSIQVRARFPGDAGNMRVQFTLRMGQNVLSQDAKGPRVNAVQNNDVVWIGDVVDPIESPPGSGNLYLANFDDQSQAWQFASSGSPVHEILSLKDLRPDAGDAVHIVTLTVTVIPNDGRSVPQVWSDLPLDPAHERAGVRDSFLEHFSRQPSSLSQARSVPIVLDASADVTTGIDVVDAVFGLAKAVTALNDLASNDSQTRARSTDQKRTVESLLQGGNDGIRPTFNEYDGQAADDSTFRTGLRALEGIDDISIVAAPGSTHDYESSDARRSDANTIISLLIAHAQLMRYRIAVIDSGDAQSIADVRAQRAKFDSSYAAMYYPWVRILDPVTGREINLPPSGFVAGIYARNDINRAVYKAPANEVVNLAIGFERLLNKSQQEVLNPEGINCFRFFEGRGFRLWGARTMSSDSEWKYVNLRRYFIYLEHSIDKGTQFAVFEPNGEALWANVRRTIGDFLLNEWQSGALLGDKPEKAYFVRCDRSTMTQNDLDNGRLVCLIGIAPLRPAEFVIFRIGQFTADSKG